MTGQDDKPVVLVTNSELLMVLAGRAVAFGTEGGGEAVVRLATADELMAMAERAGQRLQAQGLPPGPGMTREQAMQLTRPLTLP